MDSVINNGIEMFEKGGPLSTALLIVSCMIIVVSLVALVVSIILGISYVKYNKKKNSSRLTGEKIARKILDQNGLQHIKVSATGSVMFGNSYSHYFKKVRLRRRTWKKDSVASLAMAAQKSSLAILDKEHDPDMEKRVKLIPVITFGPLAFIPLIIVGMFIDYVRVQQIGTASIVCSVIGLVFYLLSFVMSLLVLKTEKKAQKKAIQIVKENGMATKEEIRDMKHLFKLYNIEYVNDMILSLLELIYNVLRIMEMAQGNRSSKSK